MHCYFKLLFIVLFQAFIQVSPGSPKTFGDKWSSFSRSDALYVILPSVLSQYIDSILLSIMFYVNARYRDSVANTVEENSSVFSLI